MHMIWRTLLIFLKKPLLSKSELRQTTQITMRILPTDLDVLWHVNNGVYLSLMDFGRWDMVFRNGIYDLTRKKKWYAVVAGESIKFRKALKLFDKFELHTQTVGHDEKYFFIQQKFIKNQEIYAVGLVRVRFLSRQGGAVSTAQLLQELNVELGENKGAELSQEWFALESKFFS
jgi:acyl-CoA thioesterase FadM